MSIINDALKKMGKNRTLFLGQPQKKRQLFFAGLGAVCLLGTILVSNLMQKPSSQAKVPANAFQMRKVDIEKPLKISEFSLSGIVYDNQKPLAIINNHIVAEGAFINGAELLEIRPHYVRLSLKGEEFTLKTK